MHHDRKREGEKEGEKGREEGKEKEKKERERENLFPGFLSKELHILILLWAMQIH